MSRTNNKGRGKKKGQGKETEHEERNIFFQTVARWWQRLFLLMFWLFSAVIKVVYTLSWILWVPVLLFSWILRMCVQSGLPFLARVLSTCLQSIMFVILWTGWILILIGGDDFGCSLIRLAVLAMPFIISRSVVRILQRTVKHMWPLWVLPLLQGKWSLLRLLQGKWSYTGQPTIVHVEPNVCNGQDGIAVNLTSVGEYLDGHPATTSHPRFQFQICTTEGLNLWQGFINIVLTAYEGNRSWAGTFTEEHLRMSGSECRIEIDPSYPATFDNLLLDLSQLADLLFGHFETLNQLAPRCIQALYNSMKTPLLGPFPAPSAQKIPNFIKLMRNQPALKPAGRSSTFLNKVNQARKAMGATERATVTTAIGYVLVPIDWMETVRLLGYTLLNRTLCYLKLHPFNAVPVYGPGAKEVLRFLRNFFEHGADVDAHWQPVVWDMDDLDYLVAEVFADTISELVGHLVINVDMTGLLKHAWEDYHR